MSEKKEEKEEEVFMSRVQEAKIKKLESKEKFRSEARMKH